MYRKKYSFTPAGGGVHGKAAGTVHITMTEAGLIIQIPLISIKASLRDGEMTTEIITGKDIGGIINRYPIMNFNATGTTGKKIGTGNDKDGESRDGKRIPINTGGKYINRKQLPATGEEAPLIIAHDNMTEDRRKEWDIKTLTITDST
jgi:hypothetical protein